MNCSRAITCSDVHCGWIRCTWASVPFMHLFVRQKCWSEQITILYWVLHAVDGIIRYVNGRNCKRITEKEIQLTRTQIMPIQAQGCKDQRWGPFRQPWTISNGNAWLLVDPSFTAKNNQNCKYNLTEFEFSFEYGGPDSSKRVEIENTGIYGGGY